MSMMQMLLGAAAASDPVYVENVFKTITYRGTGSSMTLGAGLDFSTIGGLVQTKRRNNTPNWRWVDTVRGAQKGLSTSPAAQWQDGPNGSFAGELTETTGLASFTSSGYTLGADISAETNFNANTGYYAAWAWMKQAGFFDVVEYTGDGSSAGDSQTISHGLKGDVGMFVIKRKSSNGSWVAWHRGLSEYSSYDATKTWIPMNTAVDAENASTARWGTIDSSGVTVKYVADDTTEVNKNGEDYIMYLWAHDVQTFGESSDQSIIKCGTYTGTGASFEDSNSEADMNDVTLGWSPQYVMTKRMDGAGPYNVWDVARGMTMTSENYGTTDAARMDPPLRFSSNDAESNNPNDRGLSRLPDGFRLDGSNWNDNGNGAKYFYVAVRGPLQVPTDATKVYGATTFTGDAASNRLITTGMDLTSGGMLWIWNRNGGHRYCYDTCRGHHRRLVIDANYGDALETSHVESFEHNGFSVNGGAPNESSGAMIAYSFAVAPGFFAMETYQGTGSAHTEKHSLGVTPEMIVVKQLNTTSDWTVYHKDMGNGKYMRWNEQYDEDTTSAWNSTDPTSTVFSVGAGNPTNHSAGQYIAYLFASAPGVSKLGEYDGTGSDINVGCGFSAPARFVLIKNKSQDQEWILVDSTRGINADAVEDWTKLDTDQADSGPTDYVDPYSNGDDSGFKVTGTANAVNYSGHKYIYLAIA